MTRITEIAPDLFRLSIFVPDINLLFNHFLFRDDEPLLYHAGMRRMFPELKDAVASLIDLSTLRWIGLSHFETDECGALNLWLRAAPRAQPVASIVAAMVNLSDFSDFTERPSRPLQNDEVFSTGKHRFRFRSTPHLPHGWDAGMLFEETQRTLLCSDLFHQDGNIPDLMYSEPELIDGVRRTLTQYQAGPFRNYQPLTPLTEPLLQSLADLQPRTLAVMHGSSFVGDGSQALRDLARTMRDLFSPGGN